MSPLHRPTGAGQAGRLRAVAESQVRLLWGDCRTAGETNTTLRNPAAAGAQLGFGQPWAHSIWEDSFEEGPTSTTALLNVKNLSFVSKIAKFVGSEANIQTKAHKVVQKLIQFSSVLLITFNYLINFNNISTPV